MNKKADLSISIIVVAAIAMIILVIISVLLFRSGGMLNRGTNCEGLGGMCVDQYTYNTCAEYARATYSQTNLIQHRTAGCTQEGYMCCVPLS